MYIIHIYTLYIYTHTHIDTPCLRTRARDLYNHATASTAYAKSSADAARPARRAAVCPGARAPPPLRPAFTSATSGVVALTVFTFA